MSCHWVKGSRGEGGGIHTSTQGWKSTPCDVDGVTGKVFNWGWSPWWVEHYFFYLFKFFVWKLQWWECLFVCCFFSTGNMKTFTAAYLYETISLYTWRHMHMHDSFSFITLTQVKMVLWCCKGSVDVAWQYSAASTPNKIVSLLHRDRLLLFGLHLSSWTSDLQDCYYPWHFSVFFEIGKKTDLNVTLDPTAVSTLNMCRE